MDGRGSGWAESDSRVYCCQQPAGGQEIGSDGV